MQWALIAFLIFAYFGACLLAEAEERKAARVERICNRLFDLAEQGKLTQSDVDRFKAVLGNTSNISADKHD